MILTNETKTKLNTYKDEFLAEYPNSEMIVDPNGVTTESVEFPGRFDTDMINKYTDAEWLDEVVKRFLIKSIKKGDRIIKEKLIIDGTFDVE